jgi:hypothetical protein
MGSVGMTAFAQALLDICNEENSTVSVEELRNTALATLSTGNASTLISTTLNSKSFNFQVSKAADVLFAEASWAITMFNKGILTSQDMDFSFI